MWFARRPIAHRGLHDASRPENTLPAFEAAAEAGYAIELDVHLTADGQVVVFHDETLDRLTTERGPVAARSMAQLEGLRVGDSDAAIPSLKQVLDLINRRVPLLVETKNEGKAGPLESAVADVLAEYRGQVAVQSFNPMALLWFRRFAPKLTRGLLSSDFDGVELARYKKFLLRRLLLAPLGAPAFVGYDIECLPYWAPALVRRLGIPVLAWTVRSQTELARARRAADNIIFEDIRPE